MGLRDIGHTLPPGFRFYPSDEELVCYYLYKKIMNDDATTTLVEIDLHTCEPWQLPDVAKLNSKEWYFFSFRDRKYATGFRTNRATVSGYWKATGKDRAVIHPTTKAIVGMRKTLVFYKNRAPNGIKTGWIMHEFRFENPNLPPKEDWVLCRVFHKSRSENDNQFVPQNLSTQAVCIPNTYDHNFISIDTSLRHSQQDNHHQNQNQNQFKFNLNPSSSIDIPYLQLDPSTEGGYDFGGNEMMNDNIGAHQNVSKFMEMKSEDEYEFLFDHMSFEYSAINDELNESIQHENTAVFM